MKKILFFLFIALLIASPVFAYQCKAGQSGNSDECWTQVKIAETYNTLVSSGHILVVSLASSTLAENDGYLARLAASGDEEILGIAQASIASGESAMILARGRGVVKLAGPDAGIASGDILAVSASGTAAEVNAVTLGRSRFGTPLQAGTTASTSASDRNNVTGYFWL